MLTQIYIKETTLPIAKKYTEKTPTVPCRRMDLHSF